MLFNNERPKTLCESAGPQQLQAHLYLSAKQRTNPIPQPVVPDWRHRLAADVILRNIPKHRRESVVWAMEIRARQERQTRRHSTGGRTYQAVSLNK